VLAGEAPAARDEISYLTKTRHHKCLPSAQRSVVRDSSNNPRSPGRPRRI